jgi:hypothetical protein
LSASSCGDKPAASRAMRIWSFISMQILQKVKRTSTYVTTNDINLVLIFKQKFCFRRNIYRFLHKVNSVRERCSRAIEK